MEEVTLLWVEFSLELFAAVVLCANFIGTVRMARNAERWNRYCQYLMIVGIIYLFTDAMLDYLILHGYNPRNPVFTVIAALVTITYYLIFSLFVAFVTVYIRQYCPDVSRVPLLLSNGIFLLSSVIRIGDLSGFLDRNILWRQIVRHAGHVIVVLTFYLLLRYRKSFETKREWIILCIVPILPVISSLLSTFHVNFYLFPLCGVISMIFVNNFLHNNQEIQMREQKDELTRQKMQLMVSQIQPHFTFNVLNSVYVLIGSDPDKARDVVDNFSQYLRQNIDTLGSVDLIPFSRELHLIENYVYLEKVRFGDNLNVEYDLKCTNFSVPPLSVQPLIENAIKHGVMKNRDGGTVTLRSEETKDHFIISVKDNGVGFKADSPHETANVSDHDHEPVGLRNVKYRIKTICHGDLLVESTPGVGTKVRILLPKHN